MTEIEWTDETWNPIVGCSVTSPGCTIVNIGKTHVMVSERYVGGSTHPRCEISRDRWDAVAGDLLMAFNRRAKGAGIKSVRRWTAGENVVERLLGKEMLVLLWAIEMPDVCRQEICAAIRNWLGFNPEERWWLCMMAAAQTGRAEHRGVGWRAAIRTALCYDHYAMEAAE